MTDEPADFSTVTEAKSDASAQPKSDDITDASTVETVARLPDLLHIQVARRGGGPWCFAAYANVDLGSKDNFSSIAWNGHYGTRVQAAIAGADAIDDWLPTAKALKNRQQRANRSAIRVELDALDKRMKVSDGHA